MPTPVTSIVLVDPTVIYTSITAQLESVAGAAVRQLGEPTPEGQTTVVRSTQFDYAPVARRKGGSDSHTVKFTVRVSVFVNALSQAAATNLATIAGSQAYAALNEYAAQPAGTGHYIDCDGASMTVQEGEQLNGEASAVVVVTGTCDRHTGNSITALP